MFPLTAAVRSTTYSVVQIGIAVKKKQGLSPQQIGPNVNYERVDPPSQTELPPL